MNKINLYFTDKNKEKHLFSIFNQILPIDGSNVNDLVLSTKPVFISSCNRNRRLRFRIIIKESKGFIHYDENSLKRKEIFKQLSGLDDDYFNYIERAIKLLTFS